MKYNKEFFDKGINRMHTDSTKWADKILEETDGVPMQVADMDFRCAQPIQDAILERAQHACYGYSADNPDNEGALIDYWKRRHDLTIQPDQSIMIPCVITGLRACVRAFTKEGDKVAFFSPMYPPFFSTVKDNERQLVNLTMTPDAETGRFSMNLDALEEALQQGVKLVLFCNPHNPISRCWEKDEILSMVRLVKQYGAKIACDEIHADFVYAPNKLTPILSLPEAHDCTVMLCSASKTFNVAGLQQAMAVCFDADMSVALSKALGQAGAACGNIFALWATRAAYTQCDDWLDGLLEYLDEGRKVLAESVKKYLPKARLAPIEATYLAWVDFRAYQKTCKELDELFTKYGVLLTPGTAFEPTAEGYMRISFGCPHQKIEEGIRRLGEALKEA